jgi:NAD+ kinase
VHGQRRGAQVFGLAGELTRIGGAATAVPAERLAEHADLVVSLGGDGMMLRAMRLVRHSNVPVLGVNLGRLGFLAEIEPPELAEALSAIDEHRFSVEPRSGVLASFGGIQTAAFNDIVLVRIPRPRLRRRGRAAGGGQPVRAVRRRRGDRGDSDWLDRLQLLCWRSDRVTGR